MPRSPIPNAAAEDDPPRQGAGGEVLDERIRRVSQRELADLLRDGALDANTMIELVEDDVDVTRPFSVPQMPTLPSIDRDGVVRRRPSLRVDVVDASPISGRLLTKMSDLTELSAPGDEDEVVAASVRALVELRDTLNDREQRLASLHDELSMREHELELLRAKRRSPRSRRARLESDVPSSVGNARLGFLAESIDRSLSQGWRTAAEFVEHFPPSLVMGDLAHHPAVRASFLTLLLGVPERTALRTSAADAGRLLGAAIAVEDCPPSHFVRVFQKTLALSYIEPHRVWSFVAGQDLAAAAAEKRHPRHAAAKAEVARLLDRGVARGLLSPAAIVDGISIEVLGERLPRAALGALVKAALQAGRAGEAFVDADVLLAVPSATLADHLPLTLLVERVLEPMARAAGFDETPPSSRL